MKIFFTDSQYEIIVLIKNIHTNRISAIQENENKAIHNMLDGDNLDICQVCSLVDFFGRIIDFDAAYDDLVIKSVVVHMYESLIKEKKRYFNI